MGLSRIIFISGENLSTPVLYHIFLCHLPFCHTFVICGSLWVLCILVAVEFFFSCSQNFLLFVFHLLSNIQKIFFFHVKIFPFSNSITKSYHPTNKHDTLHISRGLSLCHSLYQDSIIFPHFFLLVYLTRVKKFFFRQSLLMKWLLKYRKPHIPRRTLTDTEARAFNETDVTYATTRSWHNRIFEFLLEKTVTFFEHFKTNKNFI